MSRKKGQSILEYVIVLTAIIAAIIIGVAFFANPLDDEKGVGKIMKQSADTIKGATGLIGNIGE